MQRSLRLHSVRLSRPVAGETQGDAAVQDLKLCENGAVEEEQIPQICKIDQNTGSHPCLGKNHENHHSTISWSVLFEAILVEHT